MIQIIKRYLKYREIRKRLNGELLMTYVASRAVLDVFHDMVASISIEEMDLLLQKAKDNDHKYVNLAIWYIETMHKRRNALNRSKGGLGGSDTKPE